LFDQEKLELYERHFGEGYNFYLTKIMSKLYHPEALPFDDDLITMFSSITPVIEALPLDNNLSLTRMFSSVVTPEIPVTIVGTQQKSDSISVSRKSDLIVTTPTESPVLYQYQ